MANGAAWVVRRESGKLTGINREDASARWNRASLAGQIDVLSGLDATISKLGMVFKASASRSSQRRVPLAASEP